VKASFRKRIKGKSNQADYKLITLSPISLVAQIPHLLPTQSSRNAESSQTFITRTTEADSCQQSSASNTTPGTFVLAQVARQRAHAPSTCLALAVSFPTNTDSSNKLTNSEHLHPHPLRNRP
jgi:hypothetical protein